jgi:hypothetical protein
MQNGLNSSIAQLLRKQVRLSRGHKSMRRTVLPIEREYNIKFSEIEQTNSFDESDIYNAPLNGDRNLINFKTMMYLRKLESRLASPIDILAYDEKVGLVGSRTGFGRTLQAVGSAITPGNISTIRSPVRSAIWRALTPGGGGGRGRKLPGERGYRCPAGFEFGGRFTDSAFSTCGAQLFEIPGPLALAARAIRGAMNPPSARLESLSQVVQGNASPDRAVQIQRMAQIPRDNIPNKQKFAQSVASSITTLKASPQGDARMIRRDGTIFRPIVPSSILRQFSGNKDMMDGAFVRAVQVPKDIAPDDVALLAGASMQRISFVAPNGVVISIERPRALTVGERRKFGRQLNKVIGETDQYEVGKNIKDFAERSNGAFKYTETYGDVKNPNELVTVIGKDGVERQVRRWIYETFIKAGEEARTPKQQGAKRRQVAEAGREAAERLAESSSRR